MNTIGYLGPKGSWGHQTCLDLFNEDELVALSREHLFNRYRVGDVERICVPVTTSIVGVTPYIDDVLDLPQVNIVAEYPKMHGYSLLGRPGTRRDGIREVFAHPVTLEEVKPWIDKEMPNVKRIGPAQDALRLAADLVNDTTFPTEPRAIAERFSWAPRRLNPGLSHLKERNAVRPLEAMASGPFVAYDIHRTDGTRRFVRIRGG